MTGWPAALPVLLGGAAAAVAVGLPSQGRARLQGLGGLPTAREAVGGRAEHGPVRLATDRRGLLLLVAVGAWLAGLAGGPVAALLGAAAPFAARLVIVHRHRADSVRRERARAGEVCSVLAAELRAGRAPADALVAAAEVAVGPLHSALAAAAGTARLGGEVPAALLVDGSAVPEVLRGLSTCWQVCSGAGSGLAAAVDRLGEGLRSEDARRRAVEAELAGPRATAGLLAVLPLGGLLLAAGLGASPTHVLLRTPLGAACLLLGLGLDLLGLLWTARLVGRAARAV